MPTMPSKTDFLNASNYTYQQTTNYPSGLTPLMTNGQPVTSHVNADGFYAQAFMNSSGQVIIAYEGTVPNPFSAYGRGTIGADATLASGTNPAAFTDAENFASRVAQIANQQGITNDNIFVTGHSLGGAEAEDVASTLGFGGATFGAPGIPSTTSGTTPNLTNYINYGDPVGNYASDSPYGNALGTTNQHVGSVQYVGSQTDGQALTQTATNLNNPVPGDDGSSNFFYGLGYAIGGIKFHSLDLYSNLLTGSSLQQLSQADMDTTNAYALLESLDGPLGASGAADLAGAHLVDGRVESANFDVFESKQGDFQVRQLQDLTDSNGDVSDILGVERIVTNPATGEIVSAVEHTDDGQKLVVHWDQADDTIATSRLTNTDGSYTLSAFNPDGSSVVTDYDADHQETGQTSYPAPSPTPPAPSPVPSPTPPAPSPVPSPTPPAPSPVPSPTPPAPSPVPSPTPPAPSPVPSPTPPAPSPVPSPTPPAPSPVPSPTPPAPSPVPSPTPPAPSPVPSPTPPAPSPVPSPTPPAPSPVPSPTPPAPSPVPSPTPPAPSPIPSPTPPAPSPIPSPTPPAPSPIPSPTPPAPSPVPSPTPPAPSPIPSPTPPAPSPIPSPTPPAPSPIPSPTPPAPSPIPSPTPPAPSPIPSPTPPAPSPIPSPTPPAPSPIPAPAPSPIPSPVFSPFASAAHRAFKEMGPDNADGRGLHPRVGPAAGPAAASASVGATERANPLPASAAGLGQPAASLMQHGYVTGSPVQHLPPAQSPAAQLQAASRLLASAAAGKPRSLADAIAQAVRERLGVRPAPHSGSTATPKLPATDGAPSVDAAQTAAALLRQAVVAYASGGVIAPHMLDAQGQAPQHVAGTPPGVSHH